ncbi:hypothetical protein AMECASPLE_029014 [Ameca splendens]|uniref:Uncharacterized protein n=1 Tax=Ameca splendens TaxID=208324 RepID=A0ABV0Z531_9TELE
MPRGRCLRGDSGNVFTFLKLGNKAEAWSPTFRSPRAAEAKQSIGCIGTTHLISNKCRSFNNKTTRLGTEVKNNVFFVVMHQWGEQWRTVEHPPTPHMVTCRHFQ